MEIQLSKQQKVWFADRMDESHTGRVLIPSRLYDKFRKINGGQFRELSKVTIQCYLIDFCYKRNIGE